VDVTLDARAEGLIVHPWDDFAHLPWDAEMVQGMLDFPMHRFDNVDF
jgi:hypothetical protein